MTKQVKHVYEFGPFHLDATEGVLRRNGREIVLRPKENLVLLTLVESSGHTVTKEAFLEKCWPDRFVEESNITQIISVLRRIFSEEGDEYEYIETRPKQGYRFTAPVKLIVEEVKGLTIIANSVPSPSADLVPTYSDVSPVDSNGQYRLTLDATINDIDKPIAEAIEAILRKVSKDVTVTIRKIDEGSVILILEGTRAGFERIRELVESGQLTEILGFDIEDLRWEGREVEPQHTDQSYAEDSSRRTDVGRPTQGTLALAQSQSDFDKFLLWLDADREQAGKRYESIRQQLIKLFGRRGAKDPEELADKTIDQVAQKIEKGFAPPDLDRYFFEVARYIFLRASSYSSSPMPDLQMSYPDAVEGAAREYNCFEKCLGSLSVEDRELALAYYTQDENKLRTRKNLAAQLGVSQNAIRIRMARIREKLKKCISNCMEQSSKDT